MSAKNNSNVKRQLNTKPYKYARHVEVDEESVYVFKPVCPLREFVNM